MLILAAFLLTILVVVGVHELGHLWAAKSVGVRAETFAIGFGPEVVGWTSKSGLRWSVKLLPLGGYVRFAGDDNAASLAAAETGPVVPGSLRSVSRLKRAWIVFAGPGINLLLTVGLFAGYLLIEGTPTQTVASLHPMWERAGLKAGDRVEGFSEAGTGYEAATYIVERDGTLVTVSAPPPSLPVIGEVVPKSVADKADILPGDVVLSIEYEFIPNWTYLRAAVSKGEPLEITVWRGDGTHQLDADMTGQTVLGVRAGASIAYERGPVSVLDAAQFGVEQVGTLIVKTATGVWGTLTRGIGDCALHGPVRIAKASAETLTLGPLVFVQFLAVISAALALFNLLPIPGLDGGHLVTLAMEGATGEPLHPTVRKAMFVLGVALMIYLVLMGLVSDVLCA